MLKSMIRGFLFFGRRRTKRRRAGSASCKSRPVGFRVYKRSFEEREQKTKSVSKSFALELVRDSLLVKQNPVSAIEKSDQSK